MTEAHSGSCTPPTPTGFGGPSSSRWVCTPTQPPMRSSLRSPGQRVCGCSRPPGPCAGQPAPPDLSRPLCPAWPPGSVIARAPPPGSAAPLCVQQIPEARPHLPRDEQGAGARPLLFLPTPPGDSALKACSLTHRYIQEFLLKPGATTKRPTLQNGTRPWKQQWGHKSALLKDRETGAPGWLSRLGDRLQLRS